MRLDQCLVDRGLVPSRERGRALIMAGLVFVNGDRAEKPGQKVAEDAQLELRGDNNPYVSRGGLKLEKALQAFSVSPAGLCCMDVGASTGGFTDCLLQHGANQVYAVDVGYGQLAWPLRNDERVVVLERTNIRTLEVEKVPDSIDFFTIDTSFISLKLVIPAVTRFVSSACKGVCLVKPQFEAGKAHVGKNGVVRDPAVHHNVLLNAAEYAYNNGYSILGLDYSPIKGPKGNIEFLMCLERAEAPVRLAQETFETVCRLAQQAFEGERP